MPTGCSSVSNVYLYNYSGNWTAFLHSDVLTELYTCSYMYVKNVSTYTINTSFNNHAGHFASLLLDVFIVEVTTKFFI